VSPLEGPASEEYDAQDRDFKFCPATASLVNNSVPSIFLGLPETARKPMRRMARQLGLDFIITYSSWVAIVRLYNVSLAG